MEISKHVHSCLLVKEKDKTVLIDPGNYTFEERALDLSKISNLDFILITHEHQDHMEIPFIKQILEKFPKVKIITTPSASKILKSEGIKSFSEGNEFISVSKAPHELLLGRKSPENFLFNVSGKLTHPGDSLRFKKTCEILALPIQAPWGSMVAAVEKAVKLQPKIVIPIHDWHWREKARERMYQMAADYLKSKGIEFMIPENKISV